MSINEMKNILVEAVASLDIVEGIAQTGDLNAPLIPGSSDVDMFVLCSKIPTKEEREAVYGKYASFYTECMMNVCNGGTWGYGDIMMIQGVDVMFMYFTESEMTEFVEEIMAGKRLDKEWGFYPSGRLASIESIGILYETDRTWSKLVERVKEHPITLFHDLYFFHKDRIINEEDLGRVKLRHEMMFYHAILEDAIDHLLQTIYAMNMTYFPSRKRVEKYLLSFKDVPVNFTERLRKIVQNSVFEDKMDESVDELLNIYKETLEIGDKIFSK